MGKCDMCIHQHSTSQPMRASHRRELAGQLSRNVALCQRVMCGRGATLSEEESSRPRRALVKLRTPFSHRLGARPFRALPPLSTTFGLRGLLGLTVLATCAKGGRTHTPILSCGVGWLYLQPVRPPFQTLPHTPITNDPRRR